MDEGPGTMFTGTGADTVPPDGSPNEGGQSGSLGGEPGGNPLMGGGCTTGTGLTIGVPGTIGGNGEPGREGALGITGNRGVTG